MRDLRERLTRLVEKWEHSVGYGQGGTEQWNGATRACIQDVRALLALTRRAASSPAPEPMIEVPDWIPDDLGEATKAVRECASQIAFAFLQARAAAPAPRPEETRPAPFIQSSKRIEAADPCACGHPRSSHFLIEGSCLAELRPEQNPDVPGDGMCPCNSFQARPEETPDGR